MKDELISFDTAKLAKEKGFKEQTSYFYLEDNTGLNHTFNMFNSEDFIDVMEGSELENHNDISFSNKPYYQNRFATPTQSLLQRWLREVHNIHVNIGHINDIDLYDDAPKDEIPINCGNSYYYKINNCKDYKYSSTAYIKYEKALEEGLKQALNLI